MWYKFIKVKENTIFWVLLLISSKEGILFPRSRYLTRLNKLFILQLQFLIVALFNYLITFNNNNDYFIGFEWKKNHSLARQCFLVRRLQAKRFDGSSQFFYRMCNIYSRTKCFDRVEIFIRIQYTSSTQIIYLVLSPLLS